mmetsp:Transcript_34782/g.90758  ORF Transcript_34782/g.90758 Transcript_34782/m.90758 type:complete len:212 (+) Transcript_34782:1821-2456(+)
MAYCSQTTVSATDTAQLPMISATSCLALSSCSPPKPPRVGPSPPPAPLASAPPASGFAQSSRSASLGAVEHPDTVAPPTSTTSLISPAPLPAPSSCSLPRGAWDGLSAALLAAAAASAPVSAGSSGLASLGVVEQPDSVGSCRAAPRPGFCSWTPASWSCSRTSSMRLLTVHSSSFRRSATPARSASAKEVLASRASFTTHDHQSLRLSSD